MPKLEFTPEELKQYFTGKRDHFYATKSRELENQMRVHSDGLYPEELIYTRRPNESAEVKDYRIKIFKPKTKPYFTKVENTLNKIRRSSDWSIKYGDSSFDKIRDGEKMFEYMEEKYPVFGSLTNWAFSLLLRNYLVDANALLLVAPVELPELENEFIKPVATIFNSSDIIDFIENDYAVIRNRVGCFYMSEGKRMAGESYYIITTQTIYRYDQINGRKQFAIAYQYDHMLDELPIFKLGGIVIDIYGGHSLYESRIFGIVPEFDECLREYSDLQAAKVLSMFPKEWEFSQNECVACNATGIRMDNTQNPPCKVECKACEGKAYIASGPYSKLIVKPAAADQQQMPGEVGGFIKRDISIIELQERSCQDHIYYGLSSINFEFLAERPMATSGVKTAMDGDELNNTVHAVAEDIIAIMDKVYYFTGIYRYSTQYTRDEIKGMLPLIPVPEKFDILSAEYYDKQITSAKTNKLNPAIMNAMEVSYATKAFNNDPEIARLVGLVLKLDPLAGISEDDKMSRLSNNGITQLDYIVSSNINKFVNDAIEADINFIDLDTVKQKLKIYAMAQTQLDDQAAIIADIPDDTNTQDDTKGAI